MFERKILVTYQRAQHLLDANRELLGDALKRDNRDLWVLDVGPNQVLPIGYLSLRLVGFKDALEASEVRQKYNAIEVVAKNRDLACTCDGGWKGRQIGYREFLTEFFVESFGRS